MINNNIQPLIPVNPSGLEEIAQALLENHPEPITMSKITPAKIQNPEAYVILPGRTHNTYSYPDILVSTDKYYHSQNWNQAQETLHKDNELMVTVRQHADLITLLQSGKAYAGTGKLLPKQKQDQILDEILTVRQPWRSEWLDAKFTQQKKAWCITYHKINPGRTIQEVTEPLDPDTLREDKTLGIDLQSWLKNATPQGLPRKNITKGDLYYYHPRENTVARFDAGSDWVGLGCSWGPRSSDASLGVRRAKIKV